MSGRSGWASSPALRHACACDPTALPAVGPLGVGKERPHRLPTPASASGARTLRRNRSCGPRGAFHHHPPGHPRSCLRRVSFVSGRAGIQCAWRVGRPFLRRPRGPQRAAPGWGVGDAVVCGHRGAPHRAALLGRGLRSRGALRAGASKRRAAPHSPGNNQPHAVKKEEAGPRGKAEALHSVENMKQGGPADGQEGFSPGRWAGPERCRAGG